MKVLDLLLGRPLASDEARAECVGPAAGIPIFGLDALSSAAYGPEAALTLLIPLGAAGIAYMVPISTSIILLLAIVYFSYRQTIQAYPGGGGSYTVARQNLGGSAGLLAAAALMIDYVLTVAVGISAGVGALVSAAPSLQSHTLAICLGILVLVTLINLRGMRDTGLVFMAPTYLFVGCLLAAIAIGLFKTFVSGGHPVPVEPLPRIAQATAVPGAWLILQAFASGCTAMTGVEAVSNGVKAFRPPVVATARRTLTIVIVILAILLGGIAYLVHAYGISTTNPGQSGYQSVLSLLLGGRWPGCLLLCLHRVDPSRFGSFSQHRFRGFSAALPCHCPEQLSSAFLCNTKPQTRLLLRNLSAGRAGGHSLDFVPWRDGPPDPSVRRRSVPRFHSFAGRDGGSLEAGRR